MLHLYAALAEKERALISQRTKAALVAAKARGQVLGNPRLDEARVNAWAASRASAEAYAATAIPAIREAQAAGAKSLHQIAAALNGRGIATARGGKWGAQTGLRSSASEPLPVSTSVNAAATSKPSASAKRAMAARWASSPRPDRPCSRVLTR